MNDTVKKTAGLKGLSNLLNIVKKPALVAGAAGAASAVGYGVGKSKGKKDMAQKFNQYNKAENRMIADRAYQFGLSQKKAEIVENEIIEGKALNKIANGHAVHFINAVINPDIASQELEKVASTDVKAYPIGDTGYNSADFDNLELCAAKTASLSGVMRSAGRYVKNIASKGSKAKELVKRFSSGKGKSALDAAKSSMNTAKSKSTRLPLKREMMGAAGAAAIATGYGVRKKSN